MYSRPHIPRSALGPILIGSLLVLLAFWYFSDRQPLELASPAAVAPLAALEQPLRAPNASMPQGIALSGTFDRRSNLNIVTADGLFAPAEQQELVIEVEQALQYVAQRFGTTPGDRIGVYVGWEPGCALHGIAYTGERVVQVFTCPDLPRSRAVNILAHELVHQLAHDRYGDRHLQADMILLEGVATWGAGTYWLSGQPDFATIVRPWIESGADLPLATSYVGRPINDMNTLYYEWASFVEFLLDEYGRERFDALYVTGASAPGSADYTGVYGKTLSELEAEWRGWISKR